MDLLIKSYELVVIHVFFISKAPFICINMLVVEHWTAVEISGLTVGLLLLSVVLLMFIRCLWRERKIRKEKGLVVRYAQKTLFMFTLSLIYNSCKMITFLPNPWTLEGNKTS